MPPNKFFTAFWIVYYPLCIAFYDYVNDYVDEFMTLTLLVYTIFQINKNKRTNNYQTKEVIGFAAIMLFYLIYSLIRKVNVPMAAIIDFQQQIRPYIIFYCTWILAPQFSKRQQHWMLVSILLTLAAYLFIHRSRIGSSEDVVFGALAISAGMTYFLFTKSTKRNRNLAIAIVLLGLMCGKFKYIGECVAFISIVIFLKRKLNYNSTKVFLQIALLVVIILFFAWERFDGYFVTGMSNENLARPMMYKTAPKVLVDYFPFGPGLGTFGTSASAKTYYSQLYYDYNLSNIWGMSPSDRGAFNADSFYPALAQFGIVGIFFFIVFWKRRLQDINSIENKKYYKIALMAFLCLCIENIGDTSYLSGRGMAYFMLIGICINAPKFKLRLKRSTEKNILVK